MRHLRNNIKRLTLCALLFALSLPVAAQQPTKIPRIGIITDWYRLPRSSDRHEAFRQGLRELGYVEGKNILIEHAILLTERLDRLPVARGRDRCVSKSISSSRMVRIRNPRPPSRQPQTIPIVMAIRIRSCWRRLRGQPCSTWRKYHGTIIAYPRTYAAKGWSFSKKSVPKLSRVAVFRTSTNPGTHNRSKRD